LFLRETDRLLLGSPTLATYKQGDGYHRGEENQSVFPHCGHWNESHNDW
jgi:hypothetical protein